MNPFTLMIRAAFLALALGETAAAASTNHGNGGSEAVPYNGHIADSLRDAAAGATIPMSSYSFVAGKDGRRYSGMIVGADPTAKTKATTEINVLIVPLIVHIGSTVFDPTTVDNCLSPKRSPLAAALQSPLFKIVPFHGDSGASHAARMNGVDVGTTTYPDAMRRGEFWSFVHGTNYHVAFNVSVAPAWTMSAATVQALGGGHVLTTDCAKLGVLPTDSFRNYIRDTVIPKIAAIEPTTFTLFLTKDVVTTTSSALNCLQYCTYGYHTAVGTPVKTYAVSEYDSTLNFWRHPGVRDIAPLSHEIGEWLDDPLVTNATPAWGNIGEVSGCQSNWEPGDPLAGIDYPAITMSGGAIYHPQELAFRSWYFDARTQASTGTGGKFSSNGSLSGPARPCPTGGTY